MLIATTSTGAVTTALRAGRTGGNDGRSTCSRPLG